MQDSREIDYFGQRILQIVQPLAVSEDRSQVLDLLARSVAENFAADGCWILQYLPSGKTALAASASLSHRASTIGDRFCEYAVPSAPSPLLWRMPLLPDYQIMVIDLHDGDRVSGCAIVATKGVEWYPESKLVFQIVSDYIGVALSEKQLRIQTEITEIYPELHYRLAQAIAEEQPIDRLFATAISDTLELLKLKRGFVLSVKTEPKKALQSARSPIATTERTQVDGGQSVESERFPKGDATRTTTAAPRPAAVADKTLTAEAESVQPSGGMQIQIATTIDLRPTRGMPLPQSFPLEGSYLCQKAIANAPDPTLFAGKERLATGIDRIVFQDDRLLSTVMIPLMGSTQGRPASEALWGWLVLQDDKARLWQPAELKLLQCQIYQIALARIHRNTLRQAHSDVANRTSQVQSSLQLQAKLHEAGRKQMEKLRKANELKDEFISTIGHELRTPLTSMSLAIVMLRQADIDPARRKQYLDILEEQCQREIKLVDDLLKLQQLETKQLEFKPQRVTIERFVADRVNYTADRWPPRKDLQLSLYLSPTPIQLETDADSLHQIIEELTLNAGKFALPQTQVDVSLTAEPDRVVLRFANLCKPINSEDLEHVFDRFRRASGITQQAVPGTGLGLALVKSMVEHIQGTIDVASDLVSADVARICFTVTIPRELELN